MIYGLEHADNDSLETIRFNPSPPVGTCSLEVSDSLGDIEIGHPSIAQMTDILTKLQTTYSTLLTQLFSTLSYLSQRHPTLAPQLNGTDPNTIMHPSDRSQLVPGSEDTDAYYPLRPVSPETFAAAQDELADDLVRKGIQLEGLIARLPGKGRREVEQEERIRELVERVKEVEVERNRKRMEVRALVDRLDAVVGGMARSLNVRVRNGMVDGRETG